MHVVGVDGGGTRTRAVMVDAEGEIGGWATGGCGNFQTIGLNGVEILVDRLLEELGGEARSGAVSLCLALAGAGRPDEQAAIAALVRGKGWTTKVCVVSDARAALEGAHGGKPGLIVISGTGSMVLGKNERGEEARAGGWGPLLGDEGSGYSVGLEALRSALRARDGWGQSTVLSDNLRKNLGLGNWDEIVQKVYGGEVGWDCIAALGPCVFAAARSGDGIARQIIEAAGRALGKQVGAVARRLHMTGRVDLACAGGVFKERDMLWPALERAASSGIDQLRQRDPLLPPVLGAVLLAWEQAGYAVDEERIGKLARRCPEHL